MNRSAKKELFNKIARVYPKLSPKKRRVADLILNNYKELFLLNAKEMAAKTNVSEPTILRFVSDLGFSGFPDFEKYVKGLLHIELTSVERIAGSERRGKHENTLKAYVENTVSNLDQMTSTVSEDELKQTAQMIHQAPQVVVAGYRVSQVPALYFGYLLNKIRTGVEIDTSYSTQIQDRISLDGPSILMVMMAFPRYPRLAVEMVNYARHFGASTIGISDTLKSPIVGLTDHFVLIDVEGLSFVDPLAHVITYLGALIHEIAFIDKEATVKRLSRMEQGAKIRGEYYSVEDEEAIGADPWDLTDYRHPEDANGVKPDEADRS